MLSMSNNNYHLSSLAFLVPKLSHQLLLAFTVLWSLHVSMTVDIFLLHFFKCMTVTIKAFLLFTLLNICLNYS